MANAKDRVRETHLLYAGHKRLTSVYWPTAVDDRLDDLQQRILDSGVNASRAQVLAALVMAARRDGKTLAEMVLRYRRTRVALAAKPTTQQRQRGPRLHRPAG
jgi:hypothetical protein